MTDAAKQPVGLQPHALKDAPALIEAVFPAQKVSFEAQRERKAGSAQTLTALGNWKGRKPLILTRAIVLGMLLPKTDDPERDLEIFEQLMSFNNAGLARREPKIAPTDIARRIELANPWDFFSFSLKGDSGARDEIESATFPLDIDDYPGLKIRWRRDIGEAAKLDLLAKALATYPSYEERAGLCKRPEELDQDALYAPIWPAVNAHLAHLGIEARSHPELVEQLGILRYGHRPRVGDTFCGGGSIPFEAARLGCDVYASDLNPIACMLTWAALNIVGASPEKRAEIERIQRDVAEVVDREITELGVEHDAYGNRAKAFLYCFEARCPETGWMVPMSPSWVISRNRRVVAKLVPDHVQQRFDIEIHTGVSVKEMKAAEQGTVRNGKLFYELDGAKYSTPIDTLRGDHVDAAGETENRVRHWTKQDFRPRPEDLFQERLYCVQWIAHASLSQPRKETFYATVTPEDLKRERKVEQIVSQNLGEWQSRGLVPDMPIEAGGPPRYQGKSLILNQGWTYWHHVFNPRQILSLAMVHEKARNHPEMLVFLVKLLDYSSKLCHWNVNETRELPESAFYNQSLNFFWNYGCRAFPMQAMTLIRPAASFPLLGRRFLVETGVPSKIKSTSDIYVTDPPYADAVMYHEITEYFISWVRKSAPPPLDAWIWDSRRALAIKGSGDDFRHGMVDAYSSMTQHMPENGMQCVMFTHQDAGVWSDMVSIFWAAGLRVGGAWYIATETTSELKKGGFVQGTVVLLLRKRTPGDRPGFKQRILPEVRREVDAQIQQMLHLNEETEAKMGAPVFNDADLQMAGYAAALKVLTGYTTLGGEDVTSFALRPRRKGETTVVDEIVQQAAETANSLLVPEGLEPETWQAIQGVQRFYLRMLDMETTGASKLDNYQNFAKAFRVTDYAAVMASIKPNAARLKAVPEFKPRDLSDRTEIGPTPLGALFIAIQEFMAEKEPEVVMANLRDALIDYLQLRPVLIDMLDFIAAKARQPDVRRAAEALASRVRHQRLQ